MQAPLEGKFISPFIDNVMNGWKVTKIFANISLFLIPSMLQFI